MNSQDKIFDFIIVGQGLAGTVLAHTLEDRGFSILVVDNQPQTSSSKISAGVFNPITGKRLVKTWMADEIFPHLFRFYEQMQQKLGVDLFHPMPIEVPIYSQERKAEMETKATDPAYASWIDVTLESEHSPYYTESPVAYSKYEQSGWVNVAVFLEASKRHWESKGVYVTDNLDFDTIHWGDPETVRWKNLTAKRVVCCEGYKAMENPWFSSIAWSVVKGEVLEYTVNDIELTYILKSKAAFLLHLGGHRYKTGATYVWDDIAETITPEAREELMEKIRLAYRIEPKDIVQKVGIRPAVKGRKPILGNHPRNARLGIFNGLGTKGVSLAPYFAEMLVDFWEKGTPLMPDVDVNRFFQPNE